MPSKTTSVFQNLSLDELDTVVGGADDCSFDDPSGLYASDATMSAAPFPTQQQQDDYASGITPQGRGVIDAYDQAMAPWSTFNGLLGGVRATRLGYK